MLIILGALIAFVQEHWTALIIIALIISALGAFVFFWAEEQKVDHKIRNTVEPVKREFTSKSLTRSPKPTRITKSRSVPKPTIKRPDNKLITKEELTPHALEFFRQLKEELPPEIAVRLRSNRKVVNHGNYNNLFLFDIWDGNQTDILHRQHFKYCLAYDPSRRNDSIHDGYMHLWLNTIRIYRKRESIVAKLDRDLPKAIPKHFGYKRLDRAISSGKVFNYPKDLRQLPGILIPWYKELITAVHPILMPIIDQFSTSLEPGEQRAVVAKRGRIKHKPPGVRDPARVREYTRSIPPSWKPQILKQYHYKCFICGADLKTTDYHIDHWIPFSKGGTSILENLRPLCALKKGNREVD